MAAELKVTVKQITGWLKKRRTQEEMKEREEGAEQNDFGHYGEDMDDFKEITEINGSPAKLENYYEEEYDMDEIAPKLPYNPGHKKTKFSEFENTILIKFNRGKFDFMSSGGNNDTVDTVDSKKSETLKKNVPH